MKSTRDNIVIGIDTSCYTTSIAAISLEKSIILNEKIMLNVKENICFANSEKKADIKIA